MNGLRTLFFSLFYLFFLLNNVQCFSPAQFGVQRRHHDGFRDGHIRRSSTQSDNDAPSPKLIVFDLDGCLWKPEMYELSWHGRGSPFKPDGKGNMISASGDKVSLLGNVRSIFSELHRRQSPNSPLVGISSRTDEPDWARELLDKFLLEDGVTPLGTVFENKSMDLIEISYDSKINHFQRLSARTGIDVQDMIFFDNERGNCVQVAKLGVTVAYVPNGVTSKLYRAAFDAFPATLGQVVNLDI